MTTPEDTELAILFHDTYERLAPSFGYETRDDTKLFDQTSKNGKLMVAVAHEINQAITLHTQKELIRVIGEDEKHLNGQKMVNPTIDCNECDQPGASFIRNELRTEQRQTLAKLFNKENK